MTRIFARELVHRRLPQIIGLYLAAGWGILEFSDWAVAHFEMTFPLTDVVVAVWLVGLPIAAMLGWKLGGNGGSAAATRSAESSAKSIAVLPFANLGDSPDTEYLSDGLSEEIINSLAKIEDLNVVSRTSAFAYKGRSQDVRKIGRELNVASVLEGSVRVSGSQLRITTQLINVADGYHLWSERFDREMEDLFTIEDEIAENVVRTLRVILGENERHALFRLPTQDVRAYEYYLRGRQFFHQSRRKSLEYAREMFKRAVEIDPDYALAYAGIANSSALIHTYYPTSEGDVERADEASRRALQIDPNLPDAHAARGFALFLMKRLPEAEEEFERAIELDPRNYEAHYFYGRTCFQQGKLEEAAQRFEHAVAAREDYPAAFFAAQAREALGRKEAALAAYERALRIAEKHMDLNPDDPRAATMRAVALCRTGRLEEGLEWAQRALAIDPEDASVRYNVACLYALEGKSEEAIGCLEDAIDAGFGSRDWIANDPDLASLRDHPRFKALMSRL